MLDRLSKTARVAVLLLIAATPVPVFGDRATTDDIVTDVMTLLGFDQQHRDTLEAGEILFTGHPELEPMPNSVAVAGAMMLIGRPPHDLIDAYLSEETLRAHSDVLTADGVPEEGGDVTSLANLGFSKAEQDEIRRLLRARAGDEFNLAPIEIDRLNAVANHDDAAVEIVDAYRDALWLRLDAYRTSGIEGILPYARKSGELTYPAEEMRASLQSAAMLNKHFPEMHLALERYPESMEPITESHLLWVKKTVAKRPTIALAHRLLLVDGDIAILAEREFYVGHTYNSMLTVAAVVPHEIGSLVFATNRTFTDKVQGSGMAKSIGRKKVAAGFARRFEELREFLLASNTVPLD